MFKVALTSNEPRAKLLFDEFRKKLAVVNESDFDTIDPITKYTAALLSFKIPRSEWWGNYQMHPLVQRRRRRNLQAALKQHSEIDALFMWGSWFHPFKKCDMDIPFFVYIDQSRSLIPTSDELDTSTYGRKRSYELQVETYKACSGIFCMSEWAKKQTLESHPYLDENKVHALGWGPCGIDLSDETPDFDKKEKIVLHVSNDFMRKGIDFVLDTAKSCMQSSENIKFIVIGEDPSFSTQSAPSNVEFTGGIYNRDELSSYFRKASVFFMPHRFDRNPHVLVEAMSAGIPIVTSAQGGAIEILSQKTTGTLCPIGDIQAYSTAILNYLENPDVVRSIGETGHQLVKDFYNWDSIAERAISLMLSQIEH